MATIQQFDYSVNLLKSILWQYEKAPNLLGLVTEKQNWYTTNQTEFWTDWYDNVFNLLTANSFGLAVWSLILNVPLYIPYSPEPDDKPLFGFNAGTFGSYENSYLNFGNSNFSTRGDAIILTEEEQRFLLRLQYFKLVTRADVTDINTFLKYLCETSNIGYTGTIYALDGLDMAMKYVFTSTTFPILLIDVMLLLDVLPRPAGVLIEDIIIGQGGIFGFNSGTFGNYENTYTNFGNGNFYHGYF